MPTVKTVSVNYGRKFNLGNYESATFDVTLWADVDEGEDLNQVMHGLWAMAKENIRAQALPIKNGANTSVKEYFLGLPVELQEKAKEV